VLAVGPLACGDGGGPVTLRTEPEETSSTADTSQDDEDVEERSVHGVDLSELDLPDAEPYEEYVLVEDDTEQVEVEVPVDWADVDTRPAVRGDREVPGIWASTDLDALGSGYQVPGVQVDLRTATAPDRLFELLDADNATEESCDAPQSSDYDDGLYRGTAELWTNCSDDGAALLELVVLRAGNQYVTLEVQMLTDADVGAALRALETFTAVGLDSEEEWRSVDSEATVTTDEEFTVVVRSNPSAGDDWKVADTYDPAIVTFLYEDFESDDPSGQVAGAGGTSFFTFRALAVGTTTIELENCFQCTGGVGEVTGTRSVVVTVAL
jgi:predicted secreted protein